MNHDDIGETGADFWRLNHVSDAALERGLMLLLANVAHKEAGVVAHLAEVEARRLHLRAGYRSLFEYCLVALGFSEFEAVFRISAARTARNFPSAFGMLERREIHLSGLHLLRNYLTPENHCELLADARHKTKRQIEEQLARRFPRPDTPPSLRPLPPKVESLSSGRYRLELTIDEAFKQKLERAADRLSHANPSYDFVVVLDRALDALAAELDRGRFGVAAKSRPAAGGRHRIRPPSTSAARRPEIIAEPTASEVSSAAETSGRQPSRSRARGGVATTTSPSATPSPQPSSSRAHIPRDVSRQVAERDQHRCTFTSPDGRRCSAKAFLQLHHDEAWARGGPDTADNLRLLCAQHNRLLAEQDFGAAKILQAIERSGDEQSVACQRHDPRHASVDVAPKADDALPIPDKVA